jgi:hypothetical protein
MAVRDDFTAGEVLAAADLNDTFASKIPYAYGTATPSTTVDGFVWFDENSTPPAPKFWDGSAFETFGGGKVLQVVRATDPTDRTTTSTSFTDSGLSVTITPQKSTSAILLISVFGASKTSTDGCRFILTDNSNNIISGTDPSGGVIFSNNSMSFSAMQTLIGYSTPATLSAVTYKLRFSSSLGNAASLFNATIRAQLFAIEVSA